MVFSSWQFLLVFLPVTTLLYFVLNGRGWMLAGKAWLVLASLFFYGYWNPRYLPLIIGSILVNYVIGTRLARGHAPALPPEAQRRRKATLIFGIAANLALLCYFKYTDFFITNMNIVFGTGFALQGILLPLAISFFTFTQIAYLVDSYHGTTSRYDLLNYSLFVTFFPHLIAGPIVHHGQIMPQFADDRRLRPNRDNIILGLTVFGFGLFKKIALADSFAALANDGFDGSDPLTFFSAWVTSLSYSFQLYFDFSGYCDMAVGASLLFNIRLPDNFYSPYKATSIRDFWSRWHITLSHFLRDYVYIPLGGNRISGLRTYVNILITFLLGGFWHGATWMFVIWGALHGLALVVHRAWQSLGRPLPRPLGWLLTFLFVNAAWVFFRANSLDAAWRVLRGMVDLGSIFPAAGVLVPTDDLAWAGFLADRLLTLMPPALIGQLPALLLLVLGALVLRQRNTVELVNGKAPRLYLLAGPLLLALGLQLTFVQTSTVFLYFNF